MKNLFLCIHVLAIMGVSPLFAQPKIIQDSPKQFLLYGGLHFQSANHLQLGASLHFVNSNGNGINYSLSYYSGPLNEPEGAAVCDTWFDLQPYSGAIAYIHELKFQHTFYQKAARFRITAAAGINYGFYNMREYYRERTNAFCYSSRWKNSQSLGLSTRITADFPVFRATGFQVSINANLNPVQSIVGPAFTWTFGRVRAKI